MNITYQQRYIVYGAGLAVFVIIWYLAFYNSQSGKISEMKAGIEQINRNLSAAKSSAGGMQKINDEIKSIKEEIEQMQEKIPSKDKLLFVSSAIELYMPTSPAWSTACVDHSEPVHLAYFRSSLEPS